MLLLLIATPLAWWLAHSRKWYKGMVAAVVALPLVLPPTVLGFYLLLLMGPHGVVGELTTASESRQVAVHLCRSGGRLGAVLAAVCGAADPERIRGDGQASAGSGGDLACECVGSFRQRGVAAGASRFSHRDHSRLRAHRRRVRRGADAGRQHPRRDARALGRHLQSCRGDGIRRGALARGRHGAVLVHRAARPVSRGRQTVEG